MNFSLLISLVFLILIFIEITLSKNNINSKSKIFLCCITVSLLVIYELYTNTSSLKENFISMVLTSDIPHDSEMKVFEIKDVERKLDLDENDDITFKNLPQMYFYNDNPYSIIGNVYMDKIAYVLGNKFLNNSRIMQVNNVTKSTTKIKHIGDYLPEKQFELLKYSNNRYGGNACYFKKHETEIQLDSNLYPLGCGDNDNNLLFSDKYPKGDLQCKKYFEDKGSEYSPEFSTLKCNNQNVCDQYSEFIFFAGGYGEKIEFSDTVSILNLDFNSWSHTKFPSKEKKYNVESISLNDKVYFIGGILRVKKTSDNFLDNLTFSNKIEIYDYSKGKPDDFNCWSYEELSFNLPSGSWAEKEILYLTNHKCSTCNNKILIYGGLCIIESFKDNKWSKSGVTNNPYLIIYDPMNYDNKISVLFMPKNIFKDNISIASLGDTAVITSGKISTKAIDYAKGMIYLYKKYNTSGNSNKGKQYSSYEINENFFQGTLEEEEEDYTGEPFSDIVSLDKFTPIEPSWDSDTNFYKYNQNDNNFMSKLLDHSNFKNIFEVLETYTLTINFKVDTNIKKLAWLYGKNIKDSLVKIVLRTKPLNKSEMEGLNIRDLESFTGHNQQEDPEEFFYVYVIYFYKNIYYMLNIKDNIEDDFNDPFSIKVKKNEYVNLTFLVKNNIKSSEDMPKVYRDYKYLGNVDTPRPIHLWGWVDALKDNLVWKENELKVVIEDLKLYNKQLSDIDLLNFYIKNFNIVNKSLNEPKHSTIYLYDCKNEDNFSSNTKYLNYLNNSENNYTKVKFESKLYHVVGNNYKDTDAIFSASIENNDDLERILVVYNKKNNTTKIKKYEKLSFGKDEKLNLNMITLDTTKVGDDIIFSGLSYDSEKSTLVSNLDLIDIRLFDSYKTPIKVIDDSTLNRTMHLLIGVKDGSYFNGELGGIFVKTMGIVETSEVLKGIKNTGISKYDKYLSNNNLRNMYDYAKGAMVFKSNRLSAGKQMSFIDEEKFTFDGIKSFIMIQNINTTDLNLSFWFRVNDSRDYVLAYSIEANWEIKIKDNRLYFKKTLINDNSVIPNKWYFFECSVYPRDKKVKARLFVNIQEAYAYCKMLNKKQLTCKIGEEYNSKGDCESCPVNYKGIVTTSINESIPGEDDPTDSNNLNKVFKCVPCPEGTTTFGKTGQSQCYDPDFYSEKQTELGKNTFDSLVKSVRDYNLQRNSIKDIDRSIKNIKDMYDNF